MLLVGDDEFTSQGNGAWFLYRLALTFVVLVDAESDEAWRTVEQGIADVKRAIELTDTRLGGLLSGSFERGPVETAPREPGSLAIAAAVIGGIATAFVSGMGTSAQYLSVSGSTAGACGVSSGA